MRVAVIAITKNGAKTALKLGSELYADIYIKEEFINNIGEKQKIYPITGGLTELTGRIFIEYDAFVFVMAVGIVVRIISTFIKDKRYDPAIVVLGEKGEFVISLLSGHIGGANKLAEKVAGLTGGRAVITTSTDVNNVIAFDVFAGDNDLEIENFSELRYISSELVNGHNIKLYCDLELDGVLPKNVIKYDSCDDLTIRCAVVITNKLDVNSGCGHVLYLRPKNLILGIGCKKGTTKDQIEAAINDFMLINKMSILSLKSVATIDLKKDEPGIRDFCAGYKLSLSIVKKDEIKRVEDNFKGSCFVKEKIGVSSVAEPCAVLGGMNTKLICGKTKYNGITLALAEEERILHI
jgi:cobalt-precorrin 5A hydrolase